MQRIETMLIGILIILLVIVFHLNCEINLWTDYIAVIGIIVFLRGYFKSNNDKEE